MSKLSGHGLYPEGQMEQVKAHTVIKEAVMMERQDPQPGYRGSIMASFEEKSKLACKRGGGWLKQESPRKNIMMVWKLREGRQAGKTDRKTAG